MTKEKFFETVEKVAKETSLSYETLFNSFSLGLNEMSAIYLKKSIDETNDKDLRDFYKDFYRELYRKFSNAHDITSKER